MPYTKMDIKKLYYSIGEVSKMFDVNASLIRFWEKEFEIINPKKNKRGSRLFSESDVDCIRLIYQLVKERGYTLQGAKKKLKENKDDTVNDTEVIKRLQHIKKKLLEIKDLI